jgi:hypothetical protein
MYIARWFSRGHYVIGDEEYGHDLCVLNFKDNLIDKLDSIQEVALANKIEELISSTLKDAEGE